MLTESTPFHSENVHNTYTQILAYNDRREPQKLTYPVDIEASIGLRDLIDRLVTKMDNRLTYKKIVTHPFFEEIDWMSIRQQVPPIIPTLNGDDDTSNFEEDAKKTRRNNTFDAAPTAASKNGFCGSDLPFVGYGYVHEDTAIAGMYAQESNRSEVGRLNSHVKTLQKTIDSQMGDITKLQQNLTEYQRKSAQMTSLEKILSVTKEEMHKLKENLTEKTVEIANCRTQIKTLKNSLKIEEEQRVKNDANIADNLKFAYSKWERAKKLSEQKYEKQIAEKNSELLTLRDKLNLSEKELKTKSSECAHLQETVDNFKGRLKSTRSQNDTEKNEFAKKHRESNVHFEGQMRELKQKLQKMTDAKHEADDEMQKLNDIIQENNRKYKLMADHKDKLDQNNTELTLQLNQEIDENRKLRDEKQIVFHEALSLQNKIDEMTADLRKLRRASIANTDSIEGSASVYCSLESISSEIENQLKRDLLMAKEGENAQRSRVNELEETVDSLKADIERIKKQGITTVEEVLGRQNEKLEKKLDAVNEEAIRHKQASRTANLASWKLEKQMDTLTSEKEKLERAIKKITTEKDDIDRKYKENCVLLRCRNEQITELKGDIATLKSELQSERNKWDTIDKDRNKDKAQIVNQNTKIYKLEVDLEECRSKMRLFEQQKNALTIENKQLTTKLRKENEELDMANEKRNEMDQNYEALQKNHEMLKNVCALMETQLNELEGMYNTQLEQNKEKGGTIDKLWDDIRERDGKLLKLQQELRDEKTQKVGIDQKSSDLRNELNSVTESLTGCQERLTSMHHELMEKTNNLMKAEELTEVQREEIQNLQRVNETLDRELVIMKEEHSKRLTELFMLKEAHNKLQYKYNSLHENYNDLQKELEQLNSTMCEMKHDHIRHVVQSQATKAQYDKLIDHLRVKEMEKKKNGLMEFFKFSNSKKENIPPTVNQLQDELKRERIRSSQSRAQSLKITKALSNVSRKEEKETKITKPRDLKSDEPEQHRFDTILYSSGGGTPMKCFVCHESFGSGKPIFQCKTCKKSVCRHKCREKIDMKCFNGSSTVGRDTSDNDSIPQNKVEYNGEVLLRENDQTPPLKIHCLYEIDENIVLLGKLNFINSSL